MFKRLKRIFTNDTAPEPMFTLPCCSYFRLLVPGLQLIRDADNLTSEQRIQLQYVINCIVNGHL